MHEFGVTEFICTSIFISACFQSWLVQYSHYDTIGGGVYSLEWPIRGGFAQKGTLFQVSGMQNDRDFMSCGIRNSCEICHLGILKRLS